MKKQILILGILWLLIAAIMFWFWRLNQSSLHEKAQAMAQKDRILLESILFYVAEDLKGKLASFEQDWIEGNGVVGARFDYRNQKIEAEIQGTMQSFPLHFKPIRQEIEHQIFQMFKINNFDQRIAFALNPIQEKSQAQLGEEGAMTLFVDAAGFSPELVRLPAWQVRFKPNRASLLEQALAALEPEKERFLSTFLLSLILLVLLAFALIYALQSYRRKLTFLTSMNHDLLTPISVLKSAASNLRLNLVSPDKTERYGQIIEQSTLDLQHQIETAIDFARMELARPDQVCLGPIAGDALIHQVLNSLQILYPDVSLSIDGELGEIDSDPQILSKILKNIADNAMKHQTDGQVRVLLKPEPNPSIEFRNKCDLVRHIDRWHKPFFRESSQTKGMGLGLAITTFYAALIQAEFRLYMDGEEVVAALELSKG